MDNLVAVVCVILAISVLAVPAVAQTQVEVEDTFEDGNIDGWTGDTIELSQTSTEGNYSLLITPPDDSEAERVGTWQEGPTLDTSEGFTVTGVAQPNYDTEQDGEIRLGLIGDREDPDGNALLIFDGTNGATYLSSDVSPPTVPDSNINNDFDGTWVSYEIRSTGDNQIEAKVWEYGTSEPTEYQINETFDPLASQFTVNTGAGGALGRELYLDSVSLEGTQAEETDETLRLDTGNYLGFGETQEYTVYDLVGEREIRNDVTNSATVTSGNTSVITIDESNNEMTATTDENVSTRVNITATYQGRTDVYQVTVAEQSIENLDVLPFFGRIGAMFLDRGFQMVLASLLMSIAATRVSGVYAGLGVYQMGLTAGWLIGWVPIGLAFVGLFTTLFVGLNIAANIDYSVRK